MQFYKIVVAYDGSRYFGWQFQPNKLSVSQVLQDRFAYVFKTEISLLGASRTDAGVHALGQVAVFSCMLNLDCKKMLYAWGNALPQDIFLRSLELTPKINPQFDVNYKIYYYHFSLRKPLLFWAQFIWHINNSIDLEKLKLALNIFVGTHDFRSFCSGEYNKSTIRTISSVELQYLRRYACYRIVIKGPGFLHHMIRRIVGACINIATDSSLSTQDLLTALNQQNPNQRFVTAPAHGLMLRKIVYKIT